MIQQLSNAQMLNAQIPIIAHLHEKNIVPTFLEKLILGIWLIFLNRALNRLHELLNVEILLVNVYRL